jgi:hypothetical protein
MYGDLFLSIVGSYWSIASTVIVDLVGLDDLPKAMSIVQIVKCIDTAVALPFAGAYPENGHDFMRCNASLFLPCRLSL